MTQKKHIVCPAEHSWGLDNFFRKLIHNPKRILKNHIKPGMKVLDVGCGPGLFTIEVAKMVGLNGKVIAADLQQEMLNKLKNKIKGEKSVITLHKCEKNKIGIKTKVDFVLAFYMVHEVPNQTNFLKEIASILKPGGRILIVEPKFHVSKEEFVDTIKNSYLFGFKKLKSKKIFYSRSVLLEKE